MTLLRFPISLVLLVALCALNGTAFAPVAVATPHRPCALFASSGNNNNNNKGGFFQGVSNFFAELDAFVDDATSRRLGKGAIFYGKRKSSFYGSNDKMKKSNRQEADPSEDYMGPSMAGYFKWMPDEDGNMVPVTRMKEQNLERNWDRIFVDKKKE